MPTLDRAPVTLSWCGLTAIAGGAIALLVAAPALGKTTPKWPSQVAVHRAVLAPAHLTPSLPLPQLRIYDAGGELLGELTGYDSEALAALLPPLLDEPPRASGAGAALREETARFLDASGAPFALPAAAEGVYVVEYWAKWCLPCHALTGELRKLFAAHPRARVTLIEVEADNSALVGQGARGRRDRGASRRPGALAGRA